LFHKIFHGIHKFLILHFAFLIEIMYLNELFNVATSKKASDLHLTVNRRPILRIDGQLYEIEDEPVLKPKELEKTLLEALTLEQKEKFLKNKELDFSYEVKGARFRVNLHFEKGNTGLVARVIPPTIPTLEEIKMPEIVYDLVRLPQGLILVTGPTGHGKSTTLAAMINQINQERVCHIVTLEDPIEFLFSSDRSIIKQRELGLDMLSFAEGLKHVLRQDPNVIMVGEMRDLETIAATLTLAETGHLVLATLHTYSAAQTIDRIIDVFPPHQQPQIRLQLSMTLAGVISQRLLPKVGGGRIAAKEILINTPAVANLIRENKTAQINTVIQTNAERGMVTMEQDLKRLVQDGLLTKEVAESYLRG
jgi:twitching motility protein PilT